ncbi:GGDEF domain-containing protein [Kineococcus rubinsiae]|uniref:GGDEF domain-containing protein n=1 Tax=Kineococcus rubinsiae TaxID=2609562 RepID=UPI00142FB572|nr:sensor domain-containing diguanylate cyclase [Kineococcus rubinsiae]NIZ92448.1 diguanylate cyclase [Kineococcus rubinsiae]
MQTSPPALDAPQHLDGPQHLDAPQHLVDVWAAFPDPAWTVDDAGLVLAWNPAAAATFGWSAPDALGRPLEDLVGRPLTSTAGGVLLRHRDGAAVTGDLTLWSATGPAGEALHLGCLRAVAGRGPLERHFEDSGDSIVTVDGDAVVRSLNAGAEQLWGVRAADVVGRPIAEMYRADPPRLALHLETMFAAFRAGRPWRDVEIDTTRLDGRELRLVAAASALLDADGAVAGAVLVSRDVTPVRELEHSLRVATRALRARASQRVQTTQRDALTGVASRSLLQERLTLALAEAAASGEPLRVLAADLDGFRAVNDSYGHPTGDALLIAFAEHLRSQLPLSATAGRLGADEFAVVLPGLSEADAAGILARVTDWVPPAPLPSRGRRDADQLVGVSAGVVLARESECRASFDTGVRSVLARVDDAVAVAKDLRRAATAAAPRSDGPERRAR